MLTKHVQYKYLKKRNVDNKNARNIEEWEN